MPIIFDIANLVDVVSGQDVVISIGFHHDMMINVWDLKAKKKLASNKISTKVKPNYLMTGQSPCVY